MASCTRRIEVRLARGIHTGAANWVCPPGRRRYRTSQRATVWAISVPWSSSTSASARSMPAVTPAAVHTFCELRMKIGSASTRTAGNSRAKCSAKAQCVVARCPSQQPRFGRKKRARAHGDDAAGGAGDGFDPVDEGRFGPCGIDSGATGQDHGVDGVAEESTITTLRAMNASVGQALAWRPRHTPHRLGHAGGAALPERPCTGLGRLCPWHR